MKRIKKTLSVDASFGLTFDGRVPPRVAFDDVLSGILQVQADAASLIGGE